MEVKILEEHGYNSAKYGMSLSFKDESIGREEWFGDCWRCSSDPSDCDGWIGEDGEDKCENWIDLVNTQKRVAHYDKVLEKHAPMGGGHNKFLRQIILWIDILAPRAWWPELDQYKVATVTQSGSTVHTITKRKLDINDFEPGTKQNLIDAYNENFPYSSVEEAKMNLPEGYLQRRVLTCNYETLRNIFKQRKGHKVTQWKKFIDEIYAQVEHPEFLKDLI